MPVSGVHALLPVEIGVQGASVSVAQACFSNLELYLSFSFMNIVTGKKGELGPSESGFSAPYQFLFSILLNTNHLSHSWVQAYFKPSHLWALPHAILSL